MEPSIFVMIASYRDSECKYTIQDLFEKAAYPHQLTVGLNWQYSHDDGDEPFIESPFEQQIKVIKFLHTDSQGVCWARALAQKLFAGEDYYLALDSHMRFVPGWDERLIKIHSQLRKAGFRKPVLSYYPPGYSVPGELLDHRMHKVTPRTMLENGKKTGIVVNSRSVEIGFQPPFVHSAACAGFLFSSGSLVKDVPYDPHLYFYGEEITLAARIWTHGYDLFHPGTILAYHLYRRQRDARSGAKFYRQAGRHQKDHDTKVKEGLSYKRVRHLLGGEVSLDPLGITEIEKYGLGNERSLYQFSKFTGICFPDATINGFGRLGVHAAEGIPVGISKELNELTRAEKISRGRRLFQIFSDVEAFLHITGSTELIDFGCSLASVLDESRLKRMKRYVGLSVDNSYAHSLSVRFDGDKRMLFRTCNYAADPLGYAELIFDGGILALLPPRVVWQILGSTRKSGARFLVVADESTNLKDCFLCNSPFYLPRPQSEQKLNASVRLFIWDIGDPRFQTNALSESAAKARRVILQLLFECVTIVRQCLAQQSHIFEELVAASLDVQRREAEGIFQSSGVSNKLCDCGPAAIKALSLWWAIRRTNLRNVRKIDGGRSVDDDIQIGYVEMQAVAWDFFISYHQVMGKDWFRNLPVAQ